MKQVTNCKNCGAALDIWKPHCEFCGTKNVNLTALDLSGYEPANFIFKMPSNMRVVDKNGADIYLSLLAIPSLEMIEMTNDSVSIYDGWDTKHTYTRSRGMEMGIKLTTVCAPEKENTLCELRYGNEHENGF